MRFLSLYLSEGSASSLAKIINRVSGFVGKTPSFTKKVASGNLFVFNSVGSPLTLMDDMKSKLPGYKFKPDGSSDTVYKFHGPAGIIWMTFMGPNAYFILNKSEEIPSFTDTDDTEKEEQDTEDAGFSEMDPGDIGAAP